MSVLAFPAIAPAEAPPESRGHSRGDVALLVASRREGSLRPARFDALADLLLGGDLLVVNTSATIAAALPAHLNGRDVRVHLSTPLSETRWVLELRTEAHAPLEPPAAGTSLELPDDGRLTMLSPYRGSDRLAEAELVAPRSTSELLARHGKPICYRGRSSAEFPLDAYQTIFACEPGSAEMASAGRPFTHQLLTSLVSRGVLIAPLILHAGVSSLERDEAPYPERYAVPPATARLVNAVRAWGGRVIAVGTTVVRALETVAAPDGSVTAGAGWTGVVISPSRGLRCVDGLLTGWHDPDSSHLHMLEALAGRALLERSYAAAVELDLRGHEFGDAHLILP